MGGSLEAWILAAVESTLSTGSARFRCSFAGEAGQVAASGEGTVDFQGVRSAMTLTFAFPDQVQVAASEVRVVTDGETIYVRVPTGRVGPQHGISDTRLPDVGTRVEMPSTWVAFETDIDGRLASPAGMVAWLRGVTGVERAAQPAEGSPVDRFKVRLELDVAVRRSPEGERTAFRKMLESGQVGLAAAATQGEIELDDVGRVRWMRVVVPPGTSPWFLAARSERVVELELYSFGAEAPITVPAVEMRIPAEDFIGSMTLEPEDGFR